MDIEEVKKAVSAMDPEVDPGSADFETAVILLSSAVVGPSVIRIAEFADIPRQRVAERGRRLRANRVWVYDKVHCNWDDEETGGISFFMDCAVADGLMERASGPEGATPPPIGEKEM